MKTIKYIAAFLPLASLLVSCNDDFLDRYPQDSVTNETYWKTEEQLRAALYPCYETFEYELLIKWAESTAETVIWGNKNSGLSKVSGGKHAYTDGFPFTSYWRYSYGHIHTCNNFLDNYNRAEIDQDVKDVYAAEVKSSELTEEDKRLFLGENARNFYGFTDLPVLPYIKNMSE